MELKVIDIDALFEDYIKDYVYKSLGKLKPDEIEDKIPELYSKFGKEKLEELGGACPDEYYKNFTPEENVEILKEHIEKNVSVSDFLCEALQQQGSESALLNAVMETENEQLLCYLINILNDKGVKVPVNRYIEFVFYDYPENLRELATESLYPFADEVSSRIIEEYANLEEDKKECAVDILSHAKVKKDEIFDILISAFAKNPSKIALYSGFLAKYGDERALAFLYSKIEEEGLNYADFEELRFAIEALGGEYVKEKDFSKDKIFKKIKNVK